MLPAILLGLLIQILAVSAQTLQCPDTFPEECSCQDFGAGPDITCVTIPMETWDIKATFDAVSDAFNNTDEAVYAVTIMPWNVVTPGHEVPAHSVSTLKTQYLYLYTDRYTRIDPEAFSGTHSTTAYLYIYEMDFQNAEEGFDLINNFQALRQLYISSGSTLSQIPAHAFDKDLQNLNSIYIRDAGLHSIGYLPFSELPNLTDIFLHDNDLTLDNISHTAFTFSRTGVYLNLERNPGITHLPEKKFGNFLRGNQNMVYVGQGYGEGCDPAYFLQCDDRIDWICAAGVTRIYGYLCRETGYDDIYDYCEQNFGNSPLYRKNLAEVKKIQMADRMRYDSLKMEEEFRRRSYAANKAKRQNQIQA